MRKWLNNYYDFSKSEFNGLLVLSGLIIALSTAPRIYGLLYKEAEDPQEQLIVKRLTFGKEVNMETTAFSERGERSKTRVFDAKNVNHRLFVFDPNSATLDDWIILGLSRKQAEGVIKYSLKGGKFRRPEDLKKMYTINSETYNRLLPYVSIKSNSDDEVPHKATLPSVKATLRIVELNSADSAALDGVKGIGPAFAIRILKYRERLGGFYKKEQLLEVFGLDSSKYLEIKDQIKVDFAGLRKISINTVSIDDFKNHPYIRYKQANALIQYRKQHGNFNSVADLTKVLMLPAEVISKIEPYLIF